MRGPFARGPVLCWTLALLLAVALMSARHAHAQPIDLGSGGPIQIDAQEALEWHDAEKVAIAIGGVRATRGTGVLTCDRLYAYFRRRTPAPGSPPPAPGTDDSNNNEIYRLVAEGNVNLYSPTDHAQGDRGIYDIDQSVLVLTGRNLKLTTPTQVVTARDTLEYWSQLHMAVARGNAVLVTTDARRVSADVLVAFFADPDAPPATAQNASGKAAPAAGQSVAAKPADPADASGKLQRVEAFGNVELRSPNDLARGGRAVYVAETDMATLVDNVRITHLDPKQPSQLNGNAAVVNMKTGVARLVPGGGQRLQGAILPAENPPPGTAPPVPPAGKKP